MGLARCLNSSFGFYQKSRAKPCSSKQSAAKSNKAETRNITTNHKATTKGQEEKGADVGLWTFCTWNAWQTYTPQYFPHLALPFPSGKSTKHGARASNLHPHRSPDDGRLPSDEVGDFAGGLGLRGKLLERPGSRLPVGEKAVARWCCLCQRLYWHGLEGFRRGKKKCLVSLEQEPLPKCRRLGAYVCAARACLACACAFARLGQVTALIFRASCAAKTLKRISFDNNLPWPSSENCEGQVVGFTDQLCSSAASGDCWVGWFFLGCL